MTCHFPECEWQPTVIRRQIRAIRSSTLVIEVETDDGSSYIKGLGNPQSNESLAFELVGTRLARVVGLQTPDYAVLDHDFLELERFDGATLPFGPVFASQALSGSPGGGAEGFLSNVVNKEDIPLLVAFDTWVANMDRCPPSDYLDPSPNWDNVFFVPHNRRFKIVIFDHTHCFSEGELADALAGDAYANDKRVYGLFPEFLPFLNEHNVRKSIEKIQSVDDAAIKQIIDEIPTEWGVPISALSEWGNQVVRRKYALEELLLDHVSAQMRLKL